MDLHKNKLDQYLQNMLQFENMKHKIYEHIINELDNENLFILENDLGNTCAGIYVYNLHENLKEFESIVNTDIENNDFDIATIDLIQSQKQEAESLVKLRLKHYQMIGEEKANELIKFNDSFDFISYFKDLYNNISNQYKGKNREFLQIKMDDITEAIHQVETNYSINEIVEKHIIDLKYLRAEIETEIQNSFVVKRVEPIAAQSKEDIMRKVYKYKIGLLFAKGELDKYLVFDSKNEFSNFTQSPNAIAKQLGDIRWEKNILALKASSTASNQDKNVLNDLEIMQLIINDCKKQKIEVHPYFLKRFEELKAKTI